MNIALLIFWKISKGKSKTGSKMIVAYLGSSLFWWIFFAAMTGAGAVLLCLAFFRISFYAKRSFNQLIIMKLLLVVFAMFSYFILMSGLFPAEIVMPNLATVNIFAHYFGVFLGILPGFYLVLHNKKK